MDNHTGKRKQKYVDHLRDLSQLTCLIHGIGHSSYECKVFKYFGSKYDKVNPFKKRSK